MKCNYSHIGKVLNYGVRNMPNSALLRILSAHVHATGDSQCIYTYTVRYR